MDYRTGSQVNPAKDGRLLLSVAVMHQAFENVTEVFVYLRSYTILRKTV